MSTSHGFGQLADTYDITELTARYNRAFDDGEGRAWAETFTEDGVLESPSSHMRGHAELMARCLANPIKVAHVTVDFSVRSDGDSATQTCTGMIFRAPFGGHLTYETLGRYTDKLVRTADGWKFQHRIFTPVDISRSLH
jgi:hypothetical protein